MAAGLWYVMLFLLSSPLFVVAELAFLLGLRKEVEHAVVEIAGPTCIREKKALA